MPQTGTITRPTLKTPRAAAVAGILFSALQIVVVWLFRTSIPADPLEPGAWLLTDMATVAFALHLIPFVGIAFLWFIGVLRDHLGAMEDRFFATIFFGSALLYLAMLFLSAATIGSLVLVAAQDPNQLVNSTTLHFGRALAYTILNVYATKMAAVFMISTSTVALYTRFAPRWIALVGYLLAVILLLGSYFIPWGDMVFPAWVLLLSIQILIANFR